MTVLIAVASRHHSTAEIGAFVADNLGAAGIATVVRDQADVDDVRPFEAVIVGSGVYAGAWLPEARDFVERFAEDLRARPVWLLSSGPLGVPAKPDGDPEGVLPLIELIRPRGHRVFAGRLDRTDLGLGEKLVVKVVRAPDGDFRDWGAIGTWAREIAGELAPTEHLLEVL